MLKKYIHTCILHEKWQLVYMNYAFCVFLYFRMSYTSTSFLYKCRILTTGTRYKITIHHLTNIYCTGYQFVLTHQACSDPPGIREGPYLAPSSPPDTPLPTNNRPWAANALQRLYNQETTIKPSRSVIQVL